MTTGPIAEQPGVLLVDDEASILSALERSLRRIPCRIYTARSGEEGLALLQRESAQVVVSDYRMGGMDGVAFLRRVKERWPDIQRVMLTGQADSQAIERAINEAEVFRFLNKPWSEAQLRATIAECLERQRLVLENRRYQAELAESNRELEEKVRERTGALLQAEKMAALGRMASGVAHEINNPLGGILAFAQVLLRDLTSADPQTREALEAIQTCARRCRDIVAQLLSFARKPCGEERAEVSLNRVAQDALALARLDPRCREIDVRLDLAADLPLVLGQAGMLQQVAINLLQNAFQASRAGQEVTLRTRAQDGKILLQVEDQGAGIPESVRPLVFEPFFTTKQVGQGTGLGLFICYGIAREHQGALTVESEEGRGSRFTLELAACGASPEEQEDGNQE